MLILVIFLSFCLGLVLLLVVVTCMFSFGCFVPVKRLAGEGDLKCEVYKVSNRMLNLAVLNAIDCGATLCCW